MELNPERQNRLEKLEKLRSAGIDVYPEKFDKKNDLRDIFDLAEGVEVQTAGRLMTFRDMGNISFAHLQDISGKVQVVFEKNSLGVDSYKLLGKCIDLGDFVGVRGEVFVTKKGERSILAKDWIFLGKALLPLPEKFHGLKDQETLYRQRYLDLIANEDAKKRFILRSEFIKTLREFYWQEKFLEVETNTLTHMATGAAARPYNTHNNALDIDVVLRISHELPLKELIVGGFEKVFEIGKAFRNEGHDPSHLPEHTHLEHYAAYWNFEDNIQFTEKMFDHLFEKLNISKILSVKDKQGNLHDVDFSTPWKRVDYVEMIKNDSGIDVTAYDDADKLRKDLSKKKIHIEGMEAMGVMGLIDNLYKKVSRPQIINPTILYNFPKKLQPLARQSDSNQDFVDQFQLVINGWEVLKAYSELVDPIEQRERFVEQAKAKSEGDEEAMEIDEDYLTAMEHGMPPISGWGMGIDRLLTIITGQDNLRDVVLFPLMKPEQGKE